MAKWEVSLNCTRLDGKMCVVGPQATPLPPPTPPLTHLRFDGILLCEAHRR